MKKSALILAILLVLSILTLTACGHKSCEHGDGNGDYICDKCDAELPKPECSHKDDNKDHKCDTCGETVSECADGNSDHKCDTCDKTLGECADGNKDHKCDTCGKTLSECADGNKDHKCDTCDKALSECADGNNDHKCDVCDKALSECADGNNDHKCDTCDKALSECADGNNDHKCDTCDKALSECADGNNDHKCDVCDKTLSECADGNNDHKCDVCDKVVSECADTDNDYSCDVCGKDMIPDNMERVSYELNISDLEANTLAADSVNGKFTIVAGSEIRNRTKTFEGVEYVRSVKIGNSTTKIKVSVPGTGKLSFLIQNGSSGAAMQFVTVTGPDGTVQNIEFLGTDGGSPVVKIEIDVTEGEWVISRGKNGGTQDIFFLALSCVVEKSNENGFELVASGNVDYLCGQSLDLSGIRLNSTFANGKTEPLSLDSVSIDSSAVNLAAEGTYPVTISYKDYAPITVNINVYLPVSVELDYDGTVEGSQSAFGNGTFVNQSFKEVYAVGDTLDTTGLFVSVVGKLGETTKTFSNISEYILGEVDLSTAGAKQLSVSYVYGESRISANATLHVVDTAPSIVDDVYQVRVDQSYTGVIGAVKDGYNMFTTVQQALDFLASSDISKRKVMLIEAGLYTEKLEITIPNLHIKGAGADKVTIEWDSIYGIKDAGGFSQVTDSTQTVAIRDSATGVIIEGVTISNYWNSQERMDAAGLAIERGLALLVQADRFIMRDSKLLGIQDTLELFTGRQYFENVFISGYTDFIFGTNNTTLFKNCTIHVIDTVKDDIGTAGYITAFKGSNKGAQDAITYGAIFYQCKFTADEGVGGTAEKPAATAIGRTWGAYAAVAVIESELGAHISLEAYDSANNKNKRYISMNGIHPTNETVQFVEYGNTGPGAITEAVAGMKMLTAEEAAKYIDIAVIFGKNNRNVSWLDPWDPEVTEIAVDDRTYYHFDQGVSAGTSHTFDVATKIDKGTTLEWAGLLISAENGSVAWNQNANSLNMKAGAFIRFTVAAGTEVTVVTYPNYNFFTINGVGTSSSDKLSQYFAEETEVTVLSTGDLYIYQIILNPDEEAPEAPTLTEIKVSGMNVNYVLGDEVATDGAVVKAYYSDNSVRVVTDFTVDISAVNNAEEGAYAVVFTYGGATVSVTVNYEDPNAAPEIVKDTYLDFSTPDSLAEVQNNPKVTIEGSVRHNGGEIQITGTISFPVKAGTTVTVVPYSNSTYVAYTLGMQGEADLVTLNEGYSRMFTEDCVVVYTGLENNYLVGIQITCPLGEGKYVFGGSTEEGDVTGILADVPGLTVSGTCKTHSGGAQLGQDSLISFVVPALASVRIKGFDTSYGQLAVEVGGEIIAMDANAFYVFTTSSATRVTIKAVNVGTDDAPAYNKSYITYIELNLLTVIDESTTISFGSEGNYKEVEGLDISAIQIGDNGGDNSQVKNGTLSFYVKAGAVVTVNGYPKYTSYTINGSDTITEQTHTYTATEDCQVVITPVDGNNYFYSIEIKYIVVLDKSTTISFGSEGNYKEVEGLDISAIQIGDNGGSNSQVKNGSMSFHVKAGAVVTVHAYPGYASYHFNGGEIITEEYYTYTATEDCEIVLSHTEGNNYFYSIEIKYIVVLDKSTTISFGSEGNYKEVEGLDISAIQIGDNGGDNSQVKNGTLSFYVKAGAVVTVNGYPKYTSYTINGSDTITEQTHTYTATEDCQVVITPVDGNNYFYSIVITY